MEELERKRQEEEEKKRAAEEALRREEEEKRRQEEEKRLGEEWVKHLALMGVCIGKSDGTGWSDA